MNSSMSEKAQNLFYKPTSHRDAKDSFGISDTDIFSLTKAIKGGEFLNNQKSWLKDIPKYL